MFIDFSTLTGTQAYFALTQAVIPRPIAWVLSDNGDATYNLAPFSFFNAVCGDPPLVMISVGCKPDGSRKDTWLNIEERSDFVVHIVPRELGQPMVTSAATLPHGDSELTRLNLPTQQVEGQRLPRVVGPRLAMFCRKHRILEIGNEPQALILGEVMAMMIDDDAAVMRDGRLFVDAAKIDPLARLGGSDYVQFGKLVSYERPK